MYKFFVKIKSNQGFTLIELLVVISIISLLSSVILATIKDARYKAEKSKFRSEVSELVKALELYKSDNGKYPGNTNQIFYIKNDTTDPLSSGTFDQAALQTAIIPRYISSMPQIPSRFNNENWQFAYYKGDAQKCEGDIYTPEYTIYTDGKLNEFVDDWSSLWLDLGEPNGWYLDDAYRCFSIK